MPTVSLIRGAGLELPFVDCELETSVVSRIDDCSTRRDYCCYPLHLDEVHRLVCGRQSVLNGFSAFPWWLDVVVAFTLSVVVSVVVAMGINLGSKDENEDLYTVSFQLNTP